MYLQRLTGSGAGVEKYDIITALAVNGLQQGGTRQTSMLRLIALITARYNWTMDEVVIGQREMAALWGVDERTAKRETRRLIEAGLLSIKRPGIRGRVAAYRFHREEAYRQTSENWQQVGPDFNERMAKREAPPEPEPAAEIKADPPQPKVVPNHPWEKTLQRLETDQPSIYQGWYQHLRADLPDENDVLRIDAPTKFIASYVSQRLMIALEQTARLYYGPRLRCVIEAPH